MAVPTIVAVTQISMWVAGPRGSLLNRFIHQHTPQVTFNISADLAGLPQWKNLPSSRFLLWFPGWESYLRSRWMREYPAIRSVSLDKKFAENRIVLRFESRMPLVCFQGHGMDGDGVIFPIDPARAAMLRTANISRSESPVALGRWIVELSHVPPLWDNVVALAQDQIGELSLELRAGTHVAWGPLDAINTAQKAHALCRVLNDARERLGGAALADVRFFNEGRIIVRPKYTKV